MPRDPVDLRAGCTLVLALALAACGDGGTDPDGPANPVPLDGPGLHLRALEVEGVPRRYRVYRPPTIAASAPAPVVVVLHGFPPVDMAAVTGMNDEADHRGFVAVYPESAWWPATAPASSRRMPRWAPPSGTGTASTAAPEAPSRC